MTRAVRNRILKDANGDIGDHLRNHIHLTNCIHLKNHMHKHSPILNDRSLMRDLIVLQRSRSLRDPSASPPPWHSPIIADLLSNDGERVGNGRRSFGIDHQHDGNLERTREKESNRKSVMSSGNQGSQFDENRKELSQGASGNSERRSRKSVVDMKYNDEVDPKTLSQQLSEILIDSDDRPVKATEEAESSAWGFSKVKRRKFRRVKRAPGPTALRGSRVPNEMSVASNSSVKGVVRQRHHPEEDREDEYDEHNVSRGPRNGCGIPFNWSRIHHRGKTFLDKAGRSLSCGLSDPRLKRGGEVPQGRDDSVFSQSSSQSNSRSKSDPEALPLLVDGSGSQGSSDNVAWAHDYSGELGIFADSLLKHHIDSDLASEARSGDPHKSKSDHRGRHQSLTQKYMPRTFRDLVGQNLVAQALSNAIVRSKVGLLYVFYGPHGTGKTSSARIFARALNCQSPEHPKPCGFCGSCIAHDMGKSRNIKEVGPVNNFDYVSIVDLLDSMVISQHPSQYRVFIFDDSDTLSPDCWGAILKVIDRAPRRVVFVLICSSLDVLPHVVVSRCQKFFFPKLKDADIIYALQWIATKEGLEMDKDALKLIASRSDGSLRDAEMTLEQLSLLGQKITVTLVQELVGLISDEKLVDLLDLALSADTVNTVKNLREIMETGVEPLALMSQLATVITDILAGSYDFTKETRRRKFFRRRQSLSKQDMEKLRQALKTLSEAEKQLRMSNDKTTWLTAALLQLAPDQQYMLPSSSAEDTSFNHTPLASNNGVDPVTVLSNGRRSSTERHHDGSPNGSKISRSRKQVARISPHGSSGYGYGKQVSGKGHTEIEDIWHEVIGNVQIGCIKEFMYREGKLMSVSYGAAPTVRLSFTSPETKSKAEKFRAYILQAFESVLGSPVTIEIRCESRKDVIRSVPTSDNGSTQTSLVHRTGYSGSTRMMPQNRDHPRSTEIIEEEPSQQEFGDHTNKRGGSYKQCGSSSALEEGRFGEQNRCRSLVRSKVSLAHVIQQSEGSSQSRAWTKRKAVSIAEKLEQENLRMEPRSRSLLCWKASRTTRRKVSRLKVRSHKPHTLLKLVSCGKCMSSRSPR